MFENLIFAEEQAIAKTKLEHAKAVFVNPDGTFKSGFSGAVDFLKAIGFEHDTATEIAAKVFRLQDAVLVTKAGTSEGVKRGWETRRGAAPVQRERGQGRQPAVQEVPAAPAPAPRPDAAIPRIDGIEFKTERHRLGDGEYREVRAASVPLPNGRYADIWAEEDGTYTVLAGAPEYGYGDFLNPVGYRPGRERPASGLHAGLTKEEADAKLAELSAMPQAPKFIDQPTPEQANKAIQDVMGAYSDYRNDANPQARDLAFHAGVGLSPEQWTKAMTDALGGDPRSNRFDARKAGKYFQQFSGKITLEPAREYSPAVYIRGDADVLKTIKSEASRRLSVDEADFTKSGALRLWWD